jgi:nitrogen fixation protein
VCRAVRNMLSAIYNPKKDVEQDIYQVKCILIIFWWLGMGMEE